MTRENRSENERTTRPGTANRGGTSLAVMALLLAIVLPQECMAQGNSTRLMVSARIASFFRLQIAYQSPALVVTADDIARGYVDVAAGTAFSVVSNSYAPFIVDFQALHPLFRSVSVSGLPAPVEVRANGSASLPGALNARNTSYQLGYRFILNSDLQPGSYPWPLQISVRQG